MVWYPVTWPMYIKYMHSSTLASSHTLKAQLHIIHTKKMLIYFTSNFFAPNEKMNWCFENTSWPCICACLCDVTWLSFFILGRRWGGAGKSMLQTNPFKRRKKDVKEIVNQTSSEEFLLVCLINFLINHHHFQAMVRPTWRFPSWKKH